MAIILKGIVCDVGHVVTRGSVLNHILQKIGRKDAMSLLYDCSAAESGSAEDFDTAVRFKMFRKIQALRGLGRSELKELLNDVPLTHGLASFVEFARRVELRLAFVGAVPASITALLFERALSDTQGPEIIGSSIQWRDGHVFDAGWICTPTEKHEAFVNWMSRNGLTRTGTVYIGDSIGDIPAMTALPRNNRIGFNATNPSVLSASGCAFEKSFDPVISYLEAGFVLPTAGQA